MRIVFCSDPLEIRKPDPLYETEVAIAKDLNLAWSLISFEDLVYEQDAVKALQRIPTQQEEEIGLYRGWMLKPAQYQQLYDALLNKGIRLINDPASYVHCHYLPESYPVIESLTPKTVWLKKRSDISMAEITPLLRIFGDRPIIVKDFVKSQKHYWNEACYIPSVADSGAVERVVHRFLELQGDDLNEGLVFREFIEFEPLTAHSKSAMPLTKEYRIFFLDGEPIYSVEYWEEGDYQGVVPRIEQFQQIAQKVKSRFFTMDIAKRLGGEWMIVELGDAQVSGLPDRADVNAFYSALAAKLIPK